MKLEQHEEILGHPKLDSLILEIRKKHLVTEEMVKKTL